MGKELIVFGKKEAWFVALDTNLFEFFAQCTFQIIKALEIKIDNIIFLQHSLAHLLMSNSRHASFHNYFNSNNLRMIAVQIWQLLDVYLGEPALT